MGRRKTRKAKQEKKRALSKGAVKKKKATIKVGDKWKRKTKFELIAPSSFQEKNIGITYAMKPQKVLNRVIKVNAIELFNDVRKQHIKLAFKVNEVQGTKAKTILNGFEVRKDYLNKFIRTRRSKVSAILNLKSSDGINLRISIVAITRGKATSKQKTALRKLLKENIKANCLKNNFEEIVKSALEGKFTKEMISQVKKIRPIIKLELIKIKKTNSA